MNHRKDFKYMVMVGVMRGTHAGFVNVVANVGVWRAFVSHGTGNSSNVAINLCRGSWIDAVFFMSLLLTYSLGAFFSGLLTGVEQFKLHPRLGIIAFVEGCVLLVTAILLDFFQTEAWSRWLYLLISIALGMQNGMYTTFSGAIIRNTHVTGLITDIGTTLGNYIRYKFIAKTKKAVPLWKLYVFIPLWLAFIVGGVAGFYGHEQLGFRALFIPAINIMVGGAVYFSVFVYTRVKQHQHHHHVNAFQLDSLGTSPDLPRISVTVNRDGRPSVDRRFAKPPLKSPLSKSFLSALQDAGSDDEDDGNKSTLSTEASVSPV